MATMPNRPWTQVEVGRLLELIEVLFKNISGAKNADFYLIKGRILELIKLVDER
jgi:hypothetical protein